MIKNSMFVKAERYKKGQETIKNLNERQRKLFYVRGKWCVNYPKHTRKKFNFKCMAKLYFWYRNKRG